MPGPDSTSWDPCSRIKWNKTLKDLREQGIISPVLPGLPPLYRYLKVMAPCIYVGITNILSTRVHPQKFTPSLKLRILVHYDSKKPLILACDASDYGIGAVLSHMVKNEDRPIAYISRTLSSAEKHYSQLKKEALAIIFAIKKFHKYLQWLHFIIESDHKPLKTLFGETKRIPQMAFSRIQCWAHSL